MSTVTGSEIDRRFAEVQTIIQLSWHNSRDLLDYGALLVPAETPTVFGEVPPVLTRFPHPESRRLSGGRSVKIADTVVAALLHDTNDTTTHWADFGGGFGIAQREYRHRIDPDGHVQLTNVSIALHGQGLELLKMKSRNNPRYLKVKKLLEDTYAPVILRENIETVALPQLANVITSVQCLQYTLDPLAALANMYSNLKPNGIMAVMCAGGLSSALRYPDKPGELMGGLTAALKEAAISHAYSHRYATSYQTFVIVKKPHTMLVPVAKSIYDAKDPLKRDRRYTAYRRPAHGYPITVASCD